MNDLYFFTIPVFIKTLSGLNTVLAKAEAHLRATGMSEVDLLADRLASDMFPFKRQVQAATDNAKGAAGRLSGKEIPSYEDNEHTIRELIERVNKTIAFLHTITPESVKGGEERHVTLPYFPGRYMTGLDYAREYAIPNFFFHVVTTYGLVRKNGVQIGKADYINGLPLRDAHD